VLYPAFLGTRQFVQVAMHVALYGIPVALLYARAERDLEHRRGSPLVA
jgi:hypothetical protein